VSGDNYFCWQRQLICRLPATELLRFGPYTSAHAPREAHKKKTKPNTCPARDRAFCRFNQLARLHAQTPLSRAFGINDVVAELRALRATVLRRWQKTSPGGAMAFQEMIRFNEAMTRCLQKRYATQDSSTPTPGRTNLGSRGRVRPGPRRSYGLMQFTSQRDWPASDRAHRSHSRGSPRNPFRRVAVGATRMARLMSGICRKAVATARPGRSGMSMSGMNEWGPPGRSHLQSLAAAVGCARIKTKNRAI
jgi:hypothetical protein